MMRHSQSLSRSLVRSNRVLSRRTAIVFIVSRTTSWSFRTRRSLGGERTKLLDFGIAKLRQIDGASMPGATKGDVLLGTPAYMSPEQCKGAGNVDGKTDCYALGVMLYRLISGRLPFHAQGSGEIMALHILQEPKPLETLCPWVPEPLAQLVAKLLLKDKDARPAMAEVVANIDRILPACAEVVRPDAESSPSPDGIIELEEESSGPDESDELDETLDSDVLAQQQAGRPSHGFTPPSATPSGLRSGPSVRLASDGSLGSAPSTLGNAVGTSDGPSQVSSVRRLVPVILAVVVGMAATVGIVLLQGNSSRTRGASQPTAQQGDAVSGSMKRVRWEINSTPSGAEVKRAADGTILGKTPWQSERLSGDGGDELRIGLLGYAERTIVLHRDRDESREIVLQPTQADNKSPASASTSTNKATDAAAKHSIAGKGRGKAKGKPEAATAQKHPATGKTGGETGLELEE